MDSFLLKIIVHFHLDYLPIDFANLAYLHNVEDHLHWLLREMTTILNNFQLLASRQCRSEYVEKLISTVLFDRVTDSPTLIKSDLFSMIFHLDISFIRPFCLSICSVSELLPPFFDF